MALLMALLEVGGVLLGIVALLWMSTVIESRQLGPLMPAELHVEGARSELEELTASSA